jgi:hypothetical protein
MGTPEDGEERAMVTLFIYSEWIGELAKAYKVVIISIILKKM